MAERRRCDLVRCFFDAIFGHNLGPGVAGGSGRGDANASILLIHINTAGDAVNAKNTAGDAVNAKNTAGDAVPLALGRCYSDTRGCRQK